MHGYKEVNESTALNSYKKDIFSVSIENGSIVINNKESNGKIKIFDLKGNLIYSSQIEKHLSINSDGFMKNNTYLIMYSDKEITQVKKLNIN